MYDSTYMRYPEQPKLETKWNGACQAKGRGEKGVTVQRVVSVLQAEISGDGKLVIAAQQSEYCITTNCILKNCPL